MERQRGLVVCPDWIMSRRDGDNRVMVGQGARGAVAVAYAQLSPGAVAIGVDRGLGHAKLPGDLFGTEMTVDKPQAIPLPGSEKPDKVLDRLLRRAHKVNRLDTRARTSLLAMVTLLRRISPQGG